MWRTASRNAGAQPARLLTLFTRSGMERLFDRFAGIALDSADQQAFARIGAEAGMEVVGPPLAQSHPE